jgi:group I intron endonuclease
MKKYSVYKVTNAVNNKIYIGITSKTVKARITQHISKSKHGSKLAFHSAISKYGIESFTVTTMHYDLTESEAINLEIDYIKKFNSFGDCGYNMTIGGDGTVGHKCPELVKISTSKRFKGVPLTKEHRLKISMANKGVKKVITDKMRAVYLARKGTHQSEALAAESRKHLEVALEKWSGSNHSCESKSRMRAAKSKPINILYMDGSVKRLITTVRRIAEDSNISAAALCKSMKDKRAIAKKESPLYGAILSYA